MIFNSIGLVVVGVGVGVEVGEVVGAGVVVGAGASLPQPPRMVAITNTTSKHIKSSVFTFLPPLYVHE